jgi:hypothetical protein
MKINKTWILSLAKKYDNENPHDKQKEESIMKLTVQMARDKKGISIALLKKMADWKGYIGKNDPDYVKEVTRLSFVTNNEKLRLEILTLLNGVNIRMASAILMFCFPEKYTVMDWRAWKSLQKLGDLESEILDTYESYKIYNEKCKKIAGCYSVSLRLLDKALWQWKGGA